MLVRIGMIEKGAGHTEVELAGWEGRLGQAAPVEVIELYRAAGSRRAGEHTVFPSVGLFEITDEDNRWYRLLEDRPHPIDIIWWRDEPVDEATRLEWDGVEGFYFGGTPFFDRLMILRGHRRWANGSVLLTDHESDLPLKVVARTLAEYLGRLCYFGGLDLVSVPGERETFAAADLGMMERELAELNFLEEWTWG